jgi:hypothetical protein
MLYQNDPLTRKPERSESQPRNNRKVGSTGKAGTTRWSPRQYILKGTTSLASIGNADGVCNVNSESLDFAGFLTLHRQFTLDDLVRQNILNLLLEGFASQYC